MRCRAFAAAWMAFLLVGVPLVTGTETWQWPSRGYVHDTEPPESPFNIGQLKPGARVPAVPVRTETGRRFDLASALCRQPTVLVFYQGRWCGHCNWQFAQLMLAWQRLEELGYQVIAVSKADTIEPGTEPPMMYRVLNRDWPPYRGQELQTLIKEYADRTEAPFPVLSDERLAVGKAFGVTFDRQNPIHLTYPQRGDMVKMGFQGGPGGYYGPAVFVVGADGRVRYEWTYNDHKVRVSAETLLAIARRCSRPDPATAFTLAEALLRPRQVKRLYLSDRGLETLPPDVARLTGLRELCLYGNSLHDLPPELAQLKGLRKLDLTLNRFERLPAAVTELTGLEELQLLGNELRTLPPEMGRLGRLRKLDLMFNPIESLPEEIGELRDLEFLRLYGHRMRDLPSTIGNLSRLRQLFMPGTKLGKKNDLKAEVIGLESLPPKIGNLQNLIELNLIFNRLRRLPPEMGRMKGLEFLHLAENRLEALPAELGELPSLGSTIFSEGIYLRGTAWLRYHRNWGGRTALSD